MELPWSLLVLSLVVRLTVALPCLNKGNLLLLRSSFLFCLGPNYTLHSWRRNPGGGEALISLSLCHSPSLSLFSLFLESGSTNIHGAHFSARALKFPLGMLSAFMSGASLVLRFYWCFACPQASALPPFPLSLSLTTSGIGNSCHLTALHATLHSSRPLD